MDLNVELLDGKLAGAKLGPCRVCQDYTVLPAFGDGRCFGCTADEIAEPDGFPQRQILLREEPTIELSTEIHELFDEAQRSVPPSRSILPHLGAGGGFSIGFHGLWLRERREWSIPGPASLVLAGLERRDAINAYCRGIRKAHRDVGLCLNCTRPSAPESPMCEVCRVTPRATYLTRKETGACVGCKGERDGAGLICGACKVKRKQARKGFVARYRAAGICIKCFKRPGESAICGPCKAKINAKRNKRDRAKRDARGLKRPARRLRKP